MIWERIRQKDADAERGRLEEAQRQRAEQRAEEEKELRQERERKAKFAEEEGARIRHLITLLHESRLIQHMADLKKGISVEKKDIVFDRHNDITLIWGKYHIEDKTELVLSGHTLKKGHVSYASLTRVQDYLYIEAKFDLRDESLEINGRNIPREKWRGNQNVIIDALADAYRNPNRKQSSEREDRERSKGSSSFSSSTECCHS